MSFLTVTPTGYPLAASGLQDTPITLDPDISSIEITSQNKNSNSNIFFIKRYHYFLIIWCRYWYGASSAMYYVQCIMKYLIFFVEVENSSSIKLRQLFNKEDCKVIMQMKQNLICPDCNPSFDMGFHKPVLLLDCGHSVCRKCSNSHTFVYCPVKGCRTSSVTADNIILSNSLEAQSDCDLIKSDGVSSMLWSLWLIIKVTQNTFLGSYIVCYMLRRTQRSKISPMSHKSNS